MSIDRFGTGWKTGNLVEERAIYHHGLTQLSQTNYHNFYNRTFTNKTLRLMIVKCWSIRHQIKKESNCATIYLCCEASYVSTAHLTPGTKQNLGKFWAT